MGGDTSTESVTLNEGGRPPHEPTPETRAQVLALARYGAPQEDIGSIIGISDDTLRKHYRAELDHAKLRVGAGIADSLVRKAMSDSHPQSVTAAIFWPKTRAGWKATNVVENKVEDPAITARRLELKENVLRAAEAYIRRGEGAKVVEGKGAVTGRPPRCSSSWRWPTAPSWNSNSTS